MEDESLVAFLITSIGVAMLVVGVLWGMFWTIQYVNDADERTIRNFQETTNKCSELGLKVEPHTTNLFTSEMRFMCDFFPYLPSNVLTNPK